jgi:hypothetical protein
VEQPHTPAVGVTASTEPDPAVLREWDALVDHTPGTDVAQLRTRAGSRFVEIVKRTLRRGR